MFITASPAPVKAALKMLGHDCGPLRLPLVSCDETERTAIHDVLAKHGLLAGVSAA
jgi:4-hydroxy-tetrahydrodipicolinate synthase